jgi:hypothetical protein
MEEESMNPRAGSRSVKAGSALVTALFVLGLVFAALMIVSMVLGVTRHGASLLYGRKLIVPAQISPEDIGPLPQGLRLATWPDVRLEVNPTTKQMLLRSAVDLLPLMLFLWGLWLMRGFLRSVLAGDPFGADNVKRLRTIGFLLVVGAPVAELVSYAIRLALFATLPPYPSIHLAFQGLSIPGNALLGGLGAFILAEVFAYGLRLREDVEATI